MKGNDWCLTNGVTLVTAPFCAIIVPSCAECFPWTKGKGRGGQDINKGVYYALILTLWNPEKISNCLSKTKQRECPVVCLYILQRKRTAVGVSIYQGVRAIWKYQAYRRGAFGVARFDRQGNSQEPHNVKRATRQGFTSWTEIRFILRWYSAIQ